MLVGKNKMLSFSLIAMIIGFMLAVQFQSAKQPELRDTRDTWQLREDLKKEMELQSRLIKEIRSNEEKLADYESERRFNQEQTLRETLNELKEEAGLSEVTGPGVKIYLNQISDDLFLESFQSYLSPDLLRRLLNELNMYGAKHVSVGGQRVVHSTVIREIANETKINGRSLKAYPIEILVVTEDFKQAKNLYNRMIVSNVKDAFFIDNLTMTILEPETKITVPAYEDVIRIRNIESVKDEEGVSN